MSEGGGAVEVRKLSVRLGDVLAVDGADLQIEEGRVTAIVGPSGCGKTTLLRTIAGFERPAAGTVRLAGELVAGDGAWVPPERRRVGMVFQEGALFPHLSVSDNVRYGVRRSADAAARIGEVLDLVGLRALSDRMPHELSGGQQQRVALARALAPSPRLVLLDEPFAGLDAALRQRVRVEVQRILEAAEITAVLVTHDQEEALSMAQSVAVMRGGRILQSGAPEDVYLRPASPTVAEIVGSGRMVPCEVSGGVLVSAFGSGGCEAPDGPGRVLLRPEDLKMLPAGESLGGCGRIVERRFYGHDVLDRVLLEEGGEIEVRCLSPSALPVGSRVRLALRGRLFRVFRPS